MKVRLGYVVGPEGRQELRYAHTMTYRTYQTLSVEERNQKLDQIIRKNLENLLKVLKWNTAHGIYFYRFSQNMIPLATKEEVEFDYITPYQTLYQEIGNYVKKNGIRLDTHSDQFCILNSTKKTVTENSIRYLEFNKKIFDAMNLPACTILHVGSGEGGKSASIERFINTWKILPESLQKMIVLENDDRTFHTKDVLELCQRIKVPFVFDYHHHLCNPCEESLEILLPQIRNTWKQSNLIPKMHFSSPKSATSFRAHNRWIEPFRFYDFLKVIAPFYDSVDIMLECKGKELALQKLSHVLRFLPSIHRFTDGIFDFTNKDCEK